MAKGRLGFYRRPSAFWQTIAKVDSLDPAQSFLALGSGKHLRGYARLDRTADRVVCGELVADSPEARRSLIDELGRTTRTVSVAFQHTWATDAPGLFEDRTYARSPRGWYVMMGKALDRKWTGREAKRQFACATPKRVR
jgi:hypothetical protein